MPIVYVDVVWLVNAVMDAVTLLTTCWVLKVPTKLWRIAVGGIIGACYALLLFAPTLSTLTTWPGKAVASLLVVGIGVPWRNWLQLARACLTYYLVAFVFAGAAIAMHFAVPGTSVTSGAVATGHGLAFETSLESLALLVSIPCGVGLLQFTLKRAQRSRQTHASLYTVHATIADRRCSFVGLVDTGNQLRDPLTRRPVCMVDASVMRQLLPEALAEALTTDDDVIANLQKCAGVPFSERLSLVPFRGAGGRQQLAIAVRPDSMELDRDGKRTAVSVPCLLAVHHEPLSVEGRFQAILHIEVLTGVDGRENDTVAKTAEHEVAHTAATVLDPDSHQTWRRG